MKEDVTKPTDRSVFEGLTAWFCVLIGGGLLGVWVYYALCGPF